MSDNEKDLAQVLNEMPWSALLIPLGVGLLGVAIVVISV